MPDERPVGTRGALIAIGVMIVIVVAAVVLIRALTASSRLQDCVLTGRPNCIPIRPSGG